MSFILMFVRAVFYHNCYIQRFSIENILCDIYIVTVFNAFEANKDI